MKTRLFLLATAAVAASGIAACSNNSGTMVSDANAAEKMTAADADAFVKRVNAEISELTHELARLSWIKATYITPDTEALEAMATERQLEFTSRIINETKQFQDLDLTGETARAIKLIKLGSTLPSPDDAAKRAELAEITTRMDSTYGRGRYCPDGEDSCLTLGELARTMATSRDADELKEAWAGWRTVSRPMRKDYQAFVELTNEGAQELGFANTGDLWRSGYDMDADAFEKETDRLWNQVKPLYDELHCYVRGKLGETYGSDIVPADGPIPAHLLGNMWSQTWGNIYDLVEPYQGVSNLDVTGALVAQGYDARRMFERAEEFFVSLGLPELPQTFWERSMIVKPRDRDVQCHASAWPIDGKEDVRIKMCTEVNEEDFATIYHELGHIYYFLLYKDLPPLFQAGAHDGFHEAIGDTIVLSMTPEYLQSIDLVGDVEKNDQAVINQQMKLALDKIAFLPFGKMVDQWRWDVFSGKTAPEDYNAAWWELRTKYQGIAPPVERSEADFDPGAKYHIPANTPYTRYFLSFILQFQFHKALCDAAGFEGPLHECSIYNSAEAGKRFAAMLELGQSKPWTVAMEQLTGSPDMDGSAIIDYFAPLIGWLKERNEGASCGW
ncbi:MAG: M2 family metallopeptidase [Pseudomonadota bacterium]